MSQISGRSGSEAAARGALRGAGRRAVWALQILLVAAALGAWLWMCVQFAARAGEREAAPGPPSMEVVNWSDPESSAFCVACHRPVGPAMVGLDVEHGHPINVRLSDAQRAALDTLATIAGPGDTLICMSCHVLGSARPFMLADTLEDSRLCRHCHAEQFGTRGAPHDFTESAPELLNRRGQRAADAGPCSGCHAAHRYTQEFTPCALDPTGRCVACHPTPACSGDAETGRHDHPGALCVECHDPHHNEFGHYLRRPGVAACTECHAEYADGRGGGMHPVGEVDRDVPATSGDASGETAREVTCRACHAIHTGGHAPMLRVAAGENDGCLACHRDGLLERGGGELPRHGRGPVLNPEQRQAVLAWGGRIGDGGELQCGSCHRVHRSPARDDLLAFRVSSDDSCAACHTEQASVIGTTHDLRINRAHETNRLGVTAQSGGACSACHLGHGSARTLTPAPGDPRGVCTTCHQNGACGESLVLSGTSHPDTACTDCHDPHQRRFGHYLAKDPAELCADCHSEQFSLMGGPHDWRLDPAGWPQELDTRGGVCLACHVPHGGERSDLSRFGSAEYDSFHDDACVRCHDGERWGADSASACLHPHEISPDQQTVDLALVPKDDQGQMRMGCRTCHDPHGGPEPVHLARVAPGMPTESLCLQCHENRSPLIPGHSSDSLSAIGYDVDSCKPCHAIHATRDGGWGQMLSPRFLMKECDLIVGETEGCVPCLGCHREGGPAPLREVFTHPPVLLTNVIEPDSPGYLPLFNESGHVDPHGRITCRTCHLAHGNVAIGVDNEALLRSLTPQQQRHHRFSVRPFDSPNVCTTCHGPNARWRYLYFHDPDRRKGQRP